MNLQYVLDEEQSPVNHMALNLFGHGKSRQWKLQVDKFSTSLERDILVSFVHTEKREGTSGMFYLAHS